MTLVAVPSREAIQRRLHEIFPEGLEDRAYCVREMAASAVFVMFYLDAVEGAGRFMRPSQVTVMSNEQAAKLTDADRLAFAHATLTRKRTQMLHPPAGRWYKENTREPIRDETLGDGLMKYGAVIALPMPPTSDKPRYALARSFADLFLVPDADFPAAAEAWRLEHLSTDALRRIALLARGAVLRPQALVVNFPDNAGQFAMSPGESSVLTKAFVETFAPRYLRQPVVLFISEAGNKADRYLNDRAQALGLVIDVGTLLPDVLLIDLGAAPMRLVFAEIVATDGPIREDRKQAFLKLAASAGFTKQDCSFVTAFSHRGSAQFRKVVNSLAWGTFAWFMNEPDKLLVFSDSQKPLGERL